jgi:malonyl-CoA O-methyltransferase
MVNEPSPFSQLDPVAVRRLLARQARLAEAPWLHQEVARRMATRLELVLRKPRHWVDWWGFLGAGYPILRNAYPQARGLIVEPNEELRERSIASLDSGKWWSPQRWRESRTLVGLDAAVGSDASLSGSADLVWSNMMLHRAIDPLALLRTWNGLLAADGFAMFSTFGPDTLQELRSVYAEAGWSAPHPPFADMHDIGDMMVACGFADPVVDLEMLTLTWSGAEALLAELRQLGSHLGPTREAGLRTPRWREDLLRALRRRADRDGRIALRFELIFCHAFKPLPRQCAGATAVIKLDQLHARTLKPGGLLASLV